MTILSKKKAGGLHLTVEDELTIYTATTQKDGLLKYLSDTQELEVDLSAVSEIDSAGLQVLLITKQEAERQGKKIRMINHSQPVIEVFELLNVSSFFGDPVVIPADWRK